jgi:hypothetical protein
MHGSGPPQLGCRTGRFCVQCNRRAHHRPYCAPSSGPVRRLGGALSWLGAMAFRIISETGIQNAVDQHDCCPLTKRLLIKSGGPTSGSLRRARPFNERHRGGGIERIRRRIATSTLRTCGLRDCRTRFTMQPLDGGIGQARAFIMRPPFVMPRYTEPSSVEELGALERKLWLIEVRLSEREQQKLRMEEQRRQTEWRLRKLQKTPMGRS